MLYCRDSTQQCAKTRVKPRVDVSTKIGTELDKRRSLANNPTITATVT